MKNSGTWVALSTMVLRNIGLQPKNVMDDPVIRVQYIARLSIQLNIADICASITVPLMITYFTLRDGLWVAPGSRVPVTPESLDNLWMRMAVQLRTAHGALPHRAPSTILVL